MATLCRVQGAKKRALAVFTCVVGHEIEYYRSRKNANQIKARENCLWNYCGPEPPSVCGSVLENERRGTCTRSRLSRPARTAPGTESVFILPGKCFQAWARVACLGHSGIQFFLKKKKKSVFITWSAFPKPGQRRQRSGAPLSPSQMSPEPRVAAWHPRQWPRGL